MPAAVRILKKAATAYSFRIAQQKVDQLQKKSTLPTRSWIGMFKS